MTKLKQQLKRLKDDERAVSPVVGFVLIFALIMIVFTLYQSSVVPAQNEEVEYEHSQLIEGQMEQLSAAFISTGPDDPPKAVSLQLGVRYPTRALAINPGTPVGSLDSTGPHTVELSTDSGSEKFDTNFINYLPNYNMKTEETQYSIEHGMVVKDYSDSGATRLASSGALFSADGETVNLNLISGNVSASQMSAVVTTDNVDTHTINISSDSATLTLPTTLEEDEWDRLLTTESGEYIPQVDGYTYSGGSSEISIDLKNGTAIDLSKVSTGDPTDENEIELEPQITNVTPTSINATLNGSTNLTVRTTDIFGSDYPDVDIDVSENGDGSVTPNGTTPGSDGEATFTYNSSTADAGNTVYVTASVPNGSGPNSSVTFELEYPSADSSNNTSTGTNREPINANNLATGIVNQLDFKITPGPPVAISGFSVITKDDASALNETRIPHQFQIVNSQRIPEISGFQPLQYAGTAEPIQFDGQDYVFTSGPRRVASSDVYLSQWRQSRGVDVHDFANSYEEADIVVYFILQDGSRRPVYIDATVPGSSASSTTSTTNTTTTSTTDTTTTDSPSTTTADTTTTTDSTTTTTNSST